MRDAYRLRGEELLLLHCSTVDYDRPSAHTRVRMLLGSELAQILFLALVPAARRRRVVHT